MTDSPSTLSGDSAGDSQDHLDPSRPAVVRWLIAGNLTAMAIVAALAGTALLSSRTIHGERASIAVRNTASAMQQAIGAQVEQIDLLLRSTVLDIDQARRNGSAGPDVVQQILVSRYGLLPGLQVLRVTDEQGAVRYGTGLPAGAPINLNDREYFVRARDDPHAGLVISEPVFGRTSHEWVLVLARRLSTPEGAFAGIAYVSLATRRLNQVLSSPNLGRDGAVSLRTATLRLVTSWADGRMDGEGGSGSGRVPADLGAAVAAHPEGGLYTGRSDHDQIERVNAYVPIAGNRLYVVAGLGVREFMAPWRTQARLVVGLAAAVIGVLCSASWLLLRAWRREIEGLAKLKLAARRNSALLRTATDGIHVLDRTGRLVESSASFAHMLGYAREDLLGRPVSDWQEEPSAARAADWCAAASGRYDFTTRHRRSDGTLIDVEVTTNTVRIDGQDLIYCSARDVTEHRRLAAEARRNLELARSSEQRTRDVADNVPASIFYADRDERLQFANATFARAVGRPARTLIGRTLREVFGSAYAAQAQSIAAALSGTPASHTSTTDADGCSRHTESRLVPKRTQEGAVEGFYCLTHDLTDRVELERLLSVQRRNLAAMTAVSGDVTVVLDRSGTILVANRAFEDHWALAPGTAEGLRLEQLYGPAFCENVVRPKLERVFAGETISLRATHALHGQRPRAFDVTYQPVRTDEGEIDAMVFTSHDVDDLVEMVNRLQRANESLQHFVRITSHDLREPLNTISQFVRLIEESAPGTSAEPLNGYLAFVTRGARRMRNMLDDLSQYVHLDEEPVPPDERVALAAVMDDVASAMSDQVSACGGTLAIHGGLPAVRGAGSLLCLVFRNLVSNGLKFTRPGQAPHVTVTADVASDTVNVTVADEGIGIAEHDLPRVFEPFRRLHRRQVYDGTGLGLATCQRVVAALGGHIEVRSQLGAWTRVTVTLRRA